MKIGDKIKNARIQKNYTQEQAAENLLVSRQTISNWENGKTLPDIMSIIKMSELYEVSIAAENRKRCQGYQGREKNCSVCMDIHCNRYYSNYPWRIIGRKSID